MQTVKNRFYFSQTKKELIYSHYSCELQKSIFCNVACNILRRRSGHIYFK